MPPLTQNSIDSAVRGLAGRLIESIQTAGGRAFIVGGAVRDALMGKTPKDLDIEVYGLETPKLEAAIAKVAPFDAVGRSFGVYKLKNNTIDISLPRRESKVGQGHKGFDVVGDPNMSFEEACARRDFTINSILWNISTGELVDPYNGRVDLDKKILRHTSPHFSEDPLRVLRAMQFAARFQFDIAPETIDLCKKITPEGLPAERLFEEWKKLILKGVQPSLGLKFLQDCGWIQYYPELAALIGCPQDPAWHPEGDAWIHTLHCLDAFSRVKVANEWEDLVVGFAVLLHDIGKATTTQFIDGHWRSRGHDVAGVPIAEKFLRRLTNETAIFDEVLPLIECHMRPRELFNAKAGDNAIRRLARKVGRIDRLIRVARADMQGRPPLAEDFPDGPWLMEQAQRLQVADSVPRALILGRHLIEMGHTPSPAFKSILEACYEAQLDGQFKDLESGIKFLKDYLERNKIR